MREVYLSMYSNTDTHVCISSILLLCLCRLDTRLAQRHTKAQYLAQCVLEKDKYAYAFISDYLANELTGVYISKTI